MSNYVWGDEKTKFFYSLSPENLLVASESVGLSPTGRVIQLNSMENRVYEIEIDLEEETENPSDRFVIAKFYRPGRWTKEQILEEHEFLFDLKEHEIPVIAPFTYDSKSLFQNDDGLYYCFFPKQGGRAIDEWNNENLPQIGRLLARLHNIGQAKQSKHRINLNPTTYGEQNLNFLLGENILPMEFKSQYEKCTRELIEKSHELFKNIKTHRTHGDCHHGNTLLGRDGIFLIDFDDMVIAPAVQDIWMVTPGRDQYAIDQRNLLLDGYEQMREFNYRELKLIEPLRALRLIHFSAWIAKRYEDESFKRAFSHFGSSQYWEKEVFELQNILTIINQQMENSPYY